MHVRRHATLVPSLSAGVGGVVHRAAPSNLREYPQYCWEFHNQLWLSYEIATSGNEKLQAVLSGRDSGNALDH